MVSMDPKNELSEREKQLMAFSWQCFSEKPKVDYKKLAGLAGMTNVASASNAWAKIQKKITAMADANGSATPEVQTPKATPGGKKRGAKALEGETPSKKAKTPSKAKKEVKDEPIDDEDGATGGDSEGEGGGGFF